MSLESGLFWYEAITYQKKTAELKYHNYTWKFSTNYNLIVV